jgi:hypothetical protein
MIVRDPPYELVSVCADADTQRMLERLLERGQERGCLRAFRWRSERSALRDPLISRPETVLSVFRQPGLPCRFLLVWDHAGCGQENQSASDLETSVRNCLSRSGFEVRDLAVVCVPPELEILLGPVWVRVKDLLASKRGRPPPEDEAVIRRARLLQSRKPRGSEIPDDVNLGLSRCPKELFEGLLSILDLRASPALFEEVGERVSIPDLKSIPAAAELAQRLVEWFPPPEVRGG